MNGRGKKDDNFTQNELQSFEQLFKLYYLRLKKYAISILHNPIEAEDMVQDIFFQAWQNRMSLDKEKNIGSYLFTTLKNRCLNTLRHKIVEEKYSIQQSKYEAEELYNISFKENDVFVSMEKQLTKELEAIISQMPAKCQTAFRLKWFEGKKIREIAEMMKISTTMVDKHLAKGLQIVREKLSPDMFIFFLIYKPSNTAKSIQTT